MSREEHIQHAPKAVNTAVITVSSSRAKDTDDSGRWIIQGLEQRGHRVVKHHVVTDQAEAIAGAVGTLLAMDSVSVILVNGGTGAGPDDVTVAAVEPLLDKKLPAFGVLFAQLSYDQIGAAALLSGAMAGVAGRTAIFCMPGSPKACALACEKLIFPELGHLTAHLNK